MAMSALSTPNASGLPDMVTYWQMVLKKSDFTSDRNFAEALVRSSQIYVGDRITNVISNGRPPQALHWAYH